MNWVTDDRSASVRLCLPASPVYGIVYAAVRRRQGRSVLCLGAITMRHYSCGVLRACVTCGSVLLCFQRANVIIGGATAVCTEDSIQNRD